MAYNNLSTNVEWMWQSNLDPFSTTEPEEWSNYSEEAYNNREHFAYLTSYTIDLKKHLQILNSDPTKRKPVKREEYSKDKHRIHPIIGIIIKKMMFDVACSMTYLHEKNIVHADLKSDNILLRSNATRWLAPELCSNDPEGCSFMSDVWAYGCVLLEIITKKLPWNKLYKTNDEVKILRACYTWSKKNQPNITKIIKHFQHTSNTDH
ncbi:unnamed protein product [Adineta steineri]|uniref:Protein kinase domain-containing protein n=1 Tax=Adineta steineri TaxID=433720 RepID=A0A819N4H2_9BILA|nr:unnamed protein product [Adineta steineri]CAF3992320.1 unnamed protein product [Adineta steineri]